MILWLFHDMMPIFFSFYVILYVIVVFFIVWIVYRIDTKRSWGVDAEHTDSVHDQKSKAEDTKTDNEK